MGEEETIRSLLKGTTGIVHAEDILVEAVKDLVKDEIKKYIREKLDLNPDLREELKEGIGDLLEAKVKEAYALVKVAKSAAKLGLELVPARMREEVTRELVHAFEKEITAILERA